MRQVCGICRREIEVEGVKVRVCFGCWLEIGKPKNFEELKEEVKKRPGLLRELVRREE